MSRLSWILLLVLVCTGCAKPANWEYKSVQKKEIETEQLNTWGDEGWELVAVTGGEPYVLPQGAQFMPRTYYFKRQK